MATRDCVDPASSRTEGAKRICTKKSSNLRADAFKATNKTVTESSIQSLAPLTAQSILTEHEAEGATKDVGGVLSVQVSDETDTNSGTSSSSSSSGSRFVWSEHMLHRLTFAVVCSRYMNREAVDWKLVAKLLGNVASPNACRKRYERHTTLLVSGRFEQMSEAETDLLSENSRQCVSSQRSSSPCILSSLLSSSPPPSLSAIPPVQPAVTEVATANPMNRVLDDLAEHVHRKHTSDEEDNHELKTERLYEMLVEQNLVAVGEENSFCRGIMHPNVVIGTLGGVKSKHWRTGELILMTSAVSNGKDMGFSGASLWKYVSSHLPGRSPKSCQLRFIRLLTNIR